MRGQIQQGLKGIGFDVYTTGDSDSSLTGDSSYALLKRPGTDNGAYLLYQVNLTTGIISNGKLIGRIGSPSDFTGGFAIAPGVPEPSSVTLLILGAAACLQLRRRAH